MSQPTSPDGASGKTRPIVGRISKLYSFAAALSGLGLRLGGRLRLPPATRALPGAEQHRSPGTNHLTDHRFSRLPLRTGQHRPTAAGATALSASGSGDRVAEVGGGACQGIDRGRPRAMPSSTLSAVQFVEELLGEVHRGRARRRQRRSPDPATAASSSASGTHPRHEARQPGPPSRVRMRPVATRSNASFSPVRRRRKTITIAGTKPRWISG